MLFLPFLDLHNPEESLHAVLLYPHIVFCLLRDDLRLPENPWKYPCYVLWYFHLKVHLKCTKMLFWVHLNWFIETRKRALYHESLILNESLWFFSNGFRCFPFQKHFRTQLMLLFCFIPKKSLTATILHVFIMSYSGRCHVIFHPWTDCVHVHFCTTSPPLTASPLRTVEVDMV